MKKVAVTGAGGFIGAYLTRKLVERGFQVLAIDNFIRGRPSRLESIASGVELVNLDVRDVEALSQALGGVDALFHLAAVNGTENFYNQPELVLDVGVRGMLSVAEACIRNNVPDLIVASSAEVYQTPATVPTDESVDLVIPNSLNPRYSYGGSKLISELIAFNYCRNKLSKVLVFRPHNVYGPDMGWKHVIPQLIEKAQAASLAGLEGIILQGDGSETRAFCYVDDIVDGIILMWERGETMNVYHIGSMEEVTIKDLASQVVGSIDDRLKTIPGELMAGGTPRRCPDIAKMRSLGFEPAVPLAEGLARTTAWYLQNPHPQGENPLL